jgi:alpha-amylase/alpha-mannosidase (GH57 family)
VSRRYVCVHGHFYQPPRENPWLEAIEPQASAYPFRDWNERITDECYRPNAASRILDETGRIVQIVNNYAAMSFNVGPTLLSWLADAAPEVYRAIIEADRDSQRRFGGHGSAMAQAYNHMIMPLANQRDKRTQVVWGIRDFEHRFGRKPAGMWLPETAVDLPTLDALAAEGIEFTVLAPSQASRVKPPGGDWHDVSGQRVDTRRAYRAELPTGRAINLFFYDGPAARAVAFEGILASGPRFAQRLLDIGEGLAHIATDGESYGHHHRHGDMALARALRDIELDPAVRLVNYAHYLELEPPDHLVEIIENSAWSCAHGVDRWNDDCGCNSGGRPDWNQRWRHPLRQALDWARDTMAEIFEQRASAILDDPWAARDDYIDVVLDRSDRNMEEFFARHAGRAVNADEMRKALELLEMQRHAMLMYTSCGWFFDDLSGIETVQIMQYAARAIELAERHSGLSLEAELVDRLSRARSNLDEHGDGRRIWSTMVRPAAIELRDVVAHWAVGSVLNHGSDNNDVYAYRIEVVELDRHRAGKTKLATGIVRVESKVTRQCDSFGFAALHMGEHHLTGGVRRFTAEEDYRNMVKQVSAAFDIADLFAAQRELDRHFLDRSFSLKSLFRAHHDRVVARILEAPLREAESSLRRLYEHNAPLIHYLAQSGVELPEVLRTAARFVLDLRIRRALEAPEPDLDAVRAGLAEAARSGTRLDEARLALVWQRAIERLAGRIAAHTDDLGLIDRLTEMVAMANESSLQVNLWRVQNEVWELIGSALPARRARIELGDDDAARWIAGFAELCDALMLRAT